MDQPVLVGVVARVVKNLASKEPGPRGPRTASVAVILWDARSPEVLLIRRAERAGDPWSGQIAFPGGKSSPEDGSARATATREAFEEVGVDLARAEFLGYGPLTATHTGTMDVIPSVFLLKAKPTIRLNGEATSFRWVKLEDLLSPEAQSFHRREYQGTEVEMPAYLVGDYLVWGLTHRILNSLIEG